MPAISDGADRVAPDRPGDPLLEHLHAGRVTREEDAVERPREVREVDHEEQRHEDDRHRPEPEAEDLPADGERVAEPRRKLGGEGLGARLELLADVRPAIELLEEIGAADALDDVRQVLDQVLHGPDERADEQVGEQAEHADQAEHDEHRRVAALHPSSLLEPADRRREDDREEERDEDPEDRLARRDERPDECDHAEDRRDRPRRDGDLDALRPRLGSCHASESSVPSGDPSRPLARDEQRHASSSVASIS